jgi:hypothetical protein
MAGWMDAFSLPGPRSLAPSVVHVCENKKLHISCVICAIKVVPSLEVDGCCSWGRRQAQSTKRVPLVDCANAASGLHRAPPPRELVGVVT